MKKILPTFILLITAFGCSTVMIKSSRLPLDGDYQSNRAKTMDWIAENDPKELIAIHGREKVESGYGDLVHQWRSGKATVIASKDWDIPIKTPWIKQNESTYFSSKNGWVLKIISPTEYYIDSHTENEVFREYFKKKEH